MESPHYLDRNAKYRRGSLLFIDPTDVTLMCASQYLHVSQVIDSLKRSGDLEETMLLTALVPDLGKVALLADEAPEHVICFIEPVDNAEPGVGLLGWTR